MTRDNSRGDTRGEALNEYLRAKRVWEVLARKQREHANAAAFPLDEKFLQELGFGKPDFRANVGDLQCVLTRLHEFTWHWNRSGPLSPQPGDPGLVAYLVERTLVIGAQFWEVSKMFVSYGRQPPET